MMDDDNDDDDDDDAVEVDDWYFCGLYREVLPNISETVSSIKTDSWFTCTILLQ